MSEYEGIQRKSLKLKSSSSTFKHKKKKKKKNLKDRLEQMASVNRDSDDAGETSGMSENVDHRTRAEIQRDKIKEERVSRKCETSSETPYNVMPPQEGSSGAAKEILEKTTKTHKERIMEFNTHLDNLSEHYDIPKVSWTK